MARRDYGIPGTPIFDGDMAQKGYALNAMCYSFNSADNRAAFKADEDAYCRKFGLSDEPNAPPTKGEITVTLSCGIPKLDARCWRTP